MPPKSLQEKVEEWKLLAAGANPPPPAQPVGPPAPPANPLVAKALAAQGKAPQTTTVDFMPDKPIGPTPLPGPGGPLTDELAATRPPVSKLSKDMPPLPTGPEDLLGGKPDPALVERLARERAAAPGTPPSAGAAPTGSGSLADPDVLRKIAKAGLSGGIGTKDIEAGYKSARANLMASAEFSQKAQQKEAEHKAEVAQWEGLKREAEAQRHAEASAKAQKEADEQEKRVKAIADEVTTAKASRKNPYADAGGGKGIGLVLLAGIAGAAAGFRGRESNALQIVNDNIERDYQQQKDAIDEKKTGLATQQGLYKQLAAKIKDEDERHAAFRVATIQDAQRYLARAADSSVDERAKAEYFKNIGLLEQQKANDLLELKAKTHASRIQSFTLALNAEETLARMKTGPAPISPREAQMNREVAQRVLPGHKTEGEPTQQDYEQAKVIADAQARWNAIIPRIQQLRQKNGGSLLPARLSDDDRAEVAALANELKLVRKSAENMGAALTENEEKLLNVLDPNTIGQMLPQLIAAHESFNRGADIQLRNRKFIPEVSWEDASSTKPKYSKGS